MAALLAVHGLVTPGVLVGRTASSRSPAPRRSRRCRCARALGPAAAERAAVDPLPARARGRSSPSRSSPSAPSACSCRGSSRPCRTRARPPPGRCSPSAWRSSPRSPSAPRTRSCSPAAPPTSRSWSGSSCSPRSLYGALALTFMDLGWWLGHVFELVGITLVGGSVAYDLRRGSQSRPLVGDLRASEIVAAEEAFLGARVRALMVRLAEKDSSTEEHTRRVAALAVELGEELGLSGDAPARSRDRRPPARRRQALGPERDPAEARPARRRRVRGHQAAPRARPGAPERARRLRRRAWSASCSTTTSVSTARAIRAASRPTISISRPASSPSATSTTRSCRRGSTAPPGRRARRSRSCSEETGTAFDPRCVAALDQRRLAATRVAGSIAS